MIRDTSANIMLNTSSILLNSNLFVTKESTVVIISGAANADKNIIMIFFFKLMLFLPPYILIPEWLLSQIQYSL
jgi:hypothetical protein